ncbi:MAG: hypothetical protein WKF31_01330 [Thermoleophilaceae bacterium]
MTQPAVNAFLAGRVPADRQGVVFGIKQSAIPGARCCSAGCRCRWWR